MRTEAVIPKFTPCAINITFETQQELDIFASMMNLTAIADTFTEITGGQLPKADVFIKIGGNPHKTNDVISSIVRHPAVTNHLRTLKAT